MTHWPFSQYKSAPSRSKICRVGFVLPVVARIQSSNLTENCMTTVEKTELCFLVYSDSSSQNNKIIHRASWEQFHVGTSFFLMDELMLVTTWDEYINGVPPQLVIVTLVSWPQVHQ